MNLVPVFAALAPLLGAAALWDLAGSRAGPANSLPLASLVSGLADRIPAIRSPMERLRIRLRLAGLEESVDLERAMGAKLAGGLAGLALAWVIAPLAPARLAVLPAVLLPAAGFRSLDFLCDRAARARAGRAAAALPDVLDLLAVGVASGQSPGTLIGAIARSGDGPLERELAVAAAEIESGRPQSAAMGAVRERLAVPELGALATAIDRSSRHGSPLAERLREQAAALRSEQRRRVGEAADRAAPKIQLVVALVLVPSVLLVMAAALLAHADALLAGY